MITPTAIAEIERFVAEEPEIVYPVEIDGDTFNFRTSLARDLFLREQGQINPSINQEGRFTK